MLKSSFAGLFLFFILSLPTPARIYNPPTETVELSDKDREFLSMALEQREPGLSDKIDLDAVRAVRVKGEGNPAHFHASYEIGPVDDTYTLIQEMYCEKNSELGGSWDCLESDRALKFVNGEKAQTVWIVGDIDVQAAIRILEFLRTQPQYPCTFLRGREEPCTEVFDAAKLASIALIRHPYGKETTYEVGDDRQYPTQYFEIEPVQCGETDCPLAITGAGIIMY